MAFLHFDTCLTQDFTMWTKDGADYNCKAHLEANMNKMFQEEARSIEIFDECDILVCGGGAAGHSAAIAAARAGAKNIILMERYGYMGGDATGGYVIMVPHLSYKNNCPFQLN